MQIATDLARTFLKKFKQERKNKYDKTTRTIEIKENDLVLIENEERSKFYPIYKGPLKVKEIKGPNALIVDEKTKKEKLVHKDIITFLSKCFYYKFSDMSRTCYHDYKI